MREEAGVLNDIGRASLERYKAKVLCSAAELEAQVEVYKCRVLLFAAELEARVAAEQLKGETMIPGNFLQDNWYMGPGKADIDTLRDLFDLLDGFSSTFRLEDGNGNKLTMRMGEDGVLIIEPVVGE
jgi:hypothetical protein